MSAIPKSCSIPNLQDSVLIDSEYDFCEQEEKANGLAARIFQDALVVSTDLSVQERLSPSPTIEEKQQYKMPYPGKGAKLGLDAKRCRLQKDASLKRRLVFFTKTSKALITGLNPTSLIPF